MGWIEVTGEQGGFEPRVSESLSAPFAGAAAPSRSCGPGLSSCAARPGHPSKVQNLAVALGGVCSG